MKEGRSVGGEGSTGFNNGNNQGVHLPPHGIGGFDYNSPEMYFEQPRQRMNIVFILNRLNQGFLGPEYNDCHNYFVEVVSYLNSQWFDTIIWRVPDQVIPLIQNVSSTFCEFYKTWFREVSSWVKFGHPTLKKVGLFINIMKLYLERLYRSYLLQNEIGLRTKASLLQLIDRDGIQTKIKSKDIPIGMESTTIEKVNVTGQNVQNKNIYQTGFTNIKGPWPKVGNSTATTVQAFEKPTTKINGEQSSRNGELKSSRNGELKSSRNDELKGIQNTGEECIQKSGDQGFKVRNNCETCIPIGNTEDPRKEIEDTIKASIGIDEPIKAGIKIEETIEPSIKMEDNIEPSIKMEDTIQESIKNGDTIEASIKNEDIIEGSITNGGTIDSRITNKDTSDIEIEKTTQQCLENKDTIEPSLENEDTIHISFDYADIIKEDTEIENVLAGIEIEHVESEELDSDNEADVLEKKRAIFKKATSVLGLVFGKMNFIELFEVKKMEAKLAKGENGQLKKFSNTLLIFMELKNAPNDNHLFNLLFLDESEKKIEINKYGNTYHFEFDQTISGIEIKISQIDNITEDSNTEENVK